MTNTTPLLPTSSFSSSSSSSSSKPPPRSLDDAIESLLPSSPSLSQLLPSLAWLFDAQQTFITVFTDPPSLLALPSSSFFLGCLAGGFLLAPLADSRLGRKNMLLLSSLTMSLSAALTPLSPSLLVYAALRFLCGFGRATLGTSALVLSTELVSPSFRDLVSILGFLCFTLGFLSLPGLAYLARGHSWRVMYVLTAVPSLVYTVLVYFMVSESPRWLLLKGRKVEAVEVIKKMMGDELNVGPSSLDSKFEFLLQSHGSQDEETSEGMFSAAKTVIQNRWAFRRLTALMTVSFGVGMVYYGMPLNLGNLSSNLYLSVALNALTELPSSLLVLLLIRRLNRRTSTLAFTASSALFSLACCTPMSGAAQMAAELAAFFAACTAFSVVVIYSIELFPTCVRNTAIGMVRQALVMGGVVAPVLVEEGRRRRVFSFGVFGLAIGCCGVFAACLPETRGKGMTDTMEEEERKGRDGL